MSVFLVLEKEYCYHLYSLPERALKNHAYVSWEIGQHGSLNSHFTWDNHLVWVKCELSPASLSFELIPTQVTNPGEATEPPQDGAWLVEMYYQEGPPRVIHTLPLVLFCFLTKKQALVVIRGKKERLAYRKVLKLFLIKEKTNNFSLARKPTSVVPFAGNMISPK